MSRSGYSDDCDGLGLYRGAVESALRGKRGQVLLKELLAALDAMPDKRLVANELEADGQFCALGVVGKCRGIDMTKLDPDDSRQVSRVFNIAESMAREIVYINDELVDNYMYVDLVGPPRKSFYGHPQIKVPVTDLEVKRWSVVRKWVSEHVK